MKYNSSFNYNSNKEKSYYNSALFRTVVFLYDSLNISEPDIITAAKIVLMQRLAVSDYWVGGVLHELLDSFDSDDAADQFALFDFLDKFGMSERLSEIVAVLYILDNQKVLDEIAQAGVLVEMLERTMALEETDVSALIKVLQDAGLDDAAHVFNLIAEFEAAGFTDRTPRKQISDFLIGRADNLDAAYDWLIPFGMKIDWRNSAIQTMPQSESTYIEIPGVDGSIVENTTYKNRLFNIVAFSRLGLDVAEKEQLKRDICQILDSTKSKPKKMVIQAADIAFDVKYAGAAEITSGPSFVKATIPLESSPYGYRLFDQSVFGIGLITNDGDTDAGCIHKISAGCDHPTFQLGKIRYSWDGVVPPNATLVIDHNSYTCYIETIEGTRTNAIDRLTGDFQTVPKHTSISITAPESTAKYLHTELKEKLLW